MRDIAGLCALLAATTFALAGCGGEKTYAADATKSCLTGTVAQVRRDADYVTRTAPATYSVRVGSNGAMLGFYNSSSDAKRALDAYEASAVSSDVLSRRGNVTLAWNDPPTSHERSVVESCLK